MAQLGLLLGFALLKVALAVAIIWVGFRGGARADGPDGGFGGGEPPAPPPVSPRGGGRRRAAALLRGRPDRSPARRGHRRERVRKAA